MKKAFTFIEMIFVIVIMGILAKFGSEIFRNVYLNYTLSTTNNKLQTETESAIEQIANRLQYRIKNSVIARDSTGPITDFKALPSALSTDNFNVLEWVGYDIDGWLGDDTNTTPTWSGFIDVDDFVNANLNTLVSPASDFSAGGRVDTLIQALSTSTIEDAAIFFTGANTDTRTDYGWDTTYAYDQNDTAAHRIRAAGTINRIEPTAGDDFTGVDVYEQYQLAWTAYALELATDGNLTLYYNYQPWRGEAHTSGSFALLMQNVTTFKFQGVGDIIKLQVCVGDEDITGEGDGGYSICKEKAIF
jgi:prepilin-type N-terminal cleavage/methylation domain-containing protein